MKNLFLTIVLLISFCLPTWAEYKPIPKELSGQYKNEMEKVIKIEFNKRCRNIKNFDEQIRLSEPDTRYTIIDIGLQSELFSFMMKLIDVTDKYTDIKKDLPITDTWFDIHKILLPYLKDNNINTRLIDKLIAYSIKKENKLRKIFLTQNDYLKDFAYLDNKNCYNLRSYHHNKSTDTYSIDMTINLTDWDKNQYKYPYKNGYITHIIFETKLHNSKINVKYKGFIANAITTQYNKIGNPEIIYGDIIDISTSKPTIIKNHIKDFEQKFLEWINLDNYINTVKTLADN